MMFSLAGRKALVIGIANAQSTAWDCAQALHARVLTEDEPFRALGADKRARIIHEQTLIVEFAHEEAIASLPTAKDRELAAQVMLYVPGWIADMAPDTQAMIARVRALLGQPGAMVDVTEDPLSLVKAIAGPRAEITSHPIMEDHV